MDQTAHVFEDTTEAIEVYEEHVHKAKNKIIDLAVYWLGGPPLGIGDILCHDHCSSAVLFRRLMWWSNKSVIPVPSGGGLSALLGVTVPVKTLSDRVYSIQ